MFLHFNLFRHPNPTNGLSVGLLVGQLLPFFYIVWDDLPTNNSLTNYPTNKHISWIWMRKKMGLEIHKML